LIRSKRGTRLAWAGIVGGPESERAGTSLHELARTARFTGLAEKSADVAVKRLDTHFIDQFGEAPDIRCNFSCSGSPHEIESKASRGRHAQAHHPPLRLGGDRRLLLILP
jgi:hypothetical protein